GGGWGIRAAGVPGAGRWATGGGRRAGGLRRDAPSGVDFLGRLGRDELLGRLATAHVLVATSVREGWGLNVSEAAACGTPSIGYRVPGLVDSVTASGGALVEPTPAALGEGLRRFFSGDLPLEPRASTVPWEDVATAVEERLSEVVRRPKPER